MNTTESHSSDNLAPMISADPKALRLLFDAQWLVSGPPSGRSVVRGIINGWMERYPSDQVTLRLPREVPLSELGLKFTNFGVVDQGIPDTNHALTVLGTRAASDKYDVFISQNFGTFFGKALKCAFVHDGIFKDHPEWFSMWERLYLGALRPSLLRTDLIFTSSGSEAARIRRLWPRLQSKVHAVGLALPDWARRDEEKPGPKILPKRSYILTVGRLNVRKNLARLISAYESSSLPATHDLVIVGQPDGVTAGVSKSDGIRFLSHVSDKQLKWIYKEADGFIFPSLDEGFGLPLLEARHFGLRIAASDIPVFRELDVATSYFDPTSEFEIRRALEALITEANSSARVAGAVYEWTEVAKRMRESIVAEMLQRRGQK